MPSYSPRLSFKQWLLIAFLLMASLFVASYFIGIYTLDYLAMRSQETATKAVRLNALAQNLLPLRTGMERSAGQYRIFHDESILQGYQNLSNQSNEIIDILQSEQAIGAEYAPQWHNTTAQLFQTLLTPLPQDAQGIATLKNTLYEQFSVLEDLRSNITTAVQESIAERNQQLQDDITQRKSWMSQIMIGLVILSLLMTLAFGTWLARPFKRIESAIIRLGENLFDSPIDIRGPSDVRKLGRRLDWLRIRLAEIDDDKSRFLRHTSHELKTPLAALREGASLLQEELPGELNSNQKNIVRILQQNATTIQNQIEDLLRFNAAAFEARKLVRKPINLLDLIEDQVDAQQLQCQTNNVQVHISGENTIVEIDSGKIGTVISNLLSNAIKFSPVNGQIEVCLSTQENYAYIDIIDMGPGIEQEDRQHIFEPFYKGKIQPNNHAHGSGIGLSIVREYIIAHGGKIELMPSQNGTHFRIQLPYADII